MNRRRVAFVLATLVLVAVPLVARATSAQNASLADIRTTPLLDDFDRPNESTLSGGGNWAKADTSSNVIQLLNNQVTLPSQTSITSLYHWAPQTLDGDVEVWATFKGALDDGAAADLGIVTEVGGTNQMDGYVLRAVNTFGFAGWQIRKRTNWGGVQVLAQAGFVGGGVATGHIVLLRRQGNALQGWRSKDGGATWTLEVSASDSTYTADLRIGLGLSVAVATSPAWDDFGGGTLTTPSSGPPPGQSNGTCSGSGSLGLSGSRCFSDPVNTRTGAFTTQVEDLTTPGTGVAFAWTRTYTSSDAPAGPLGPGWTHAYAASLVPQTNGDVVARGEEGQEMLFSKQADGAFVGAAGARATLTASAGGYELRRTDQVLYTFTSAGRLLSIEDRNGQGVDLTYDTQGRVATVTDAAGRQAAVAYNASSLVSSVSTQDGRSVSYAYASGRLASVTDVRGKQWAYSYDAGGRLATVVDPLNHVQVTNVYGAEGRVQTQTDADQQTTRFAWDPAQEIATVTDANGKSWKHAYEQGILVKEVDPLGNETELGHDSDLNTDAVTSPTNEKTTMAYDAAGNLLATTAPASLGGVQKTFAYNTRNDPTRVTDARGTITSFAYTPSGNTASVTQDGTGVASHTYDVAGRVLTSTDGNEKTTTYTYVPASGYLASITDPLGNRTTYTYDGAGRVVARVDPKGNVAGCGCAAQFTWAYTYDPAGNQLSETDPLGHVTTSVYDGAGRLQSSTNANDHRTTYSYDSANRLVAETGPDPDGAGLLAAPRTTYTYDDVGNKLTETDPRGATTIFAYDAANSVVSKTRPDPDGGGLLAAPVTAFTYDRNGNTASTVEPRGNAAGATPDDFRTTSTYDAAGRLLTATDPLGNVTANTYDAVGNLASVEDASDHVTRYAHDAAGRILVVAAPDGGVTTYAYDDAGNLLTRRDDNGHTTTYAYDDAGRLLTETGPDPDGGGPQAAPVTSHTYDPNGNRVTLTDPNGNATPTSGDGRTTYGYDRANRLTSIDYSDATADVTFTYDAAGNRVTMTDGQGTETRTYDGLDRPLTVLRGSSTFSYVYDAAGNVTRRAYPGGVVTDYTYDALDRLTAVTSGGQTTSYAYDVSSNLVQTTLPSGNGYVESRTYDRVGRLTEVSSQRGATILARFVSTLDRVGNPTQIVRSGSLAQTQTYGYDANSRLTSVCFQVGSCAGASDPFIRWTYDEVGNRLTEQRPGASTTYTYDARDRLLSAGSTSFTYDQNGNELSAGSRTFTYDLANRPKTTTQGSTTTTYAYDGDDLRVQASTGSQANRRTSFLWDMNGGLPQIALERDGSEKLLRRYVYGMRRISQTAGNGTSYFVYDGLGSVAHLASPSGQTQRTWSYEPFGEIRTEEKANGNQPESAMRFTGEYLDPTGLYHLRARQYDPATGRFLRLDPAGQSPDDRAISAYSYVANRPTVMVDASGELFTPGRDGMDVAWFAASALNWDFPDIRCQTRACGGRPARPPITCGARPGHPLSRVGINAGGRAGHRAKPLTGWKSDNAQDITVPVGTRVCAVFGGRVESANSEGSDGLTITIAGRTDRVFYHHLSVRFVERGQRVRLDQVLGRSGRSSNGAPHLHIALERGNPERFCPGPYLGRCF
ncbi:MAG: DUF6531 domain-containing protein [Gaiellaceae bacterium]